ncbi:unnamed protein product [Phyllotreta striolata]|uniref:Odorant receptor n=1 Tax=Phyllotreta striolata TaxID=444603 RepID=A0A9N9TNS3_PHYSR|nr:unnamed protein product [Phyllotreta striolata]
MDFTSKFHRNDDPLKYLIEMGFIGMIKNTYKTLLIITCSVVSTSGTIFGLFHTCFLSNWETCKRNLPTIGLIIIYNASFLAALTLKSKALNFISTLHEEGNCLSSIENSLHERCGVIKKIFLCLRLLWLVALLVVMMSMRTCIRYSFFIGNIIDKDFIGSYLPMFIIYSLSYAASLVVAYYALSLIAVYIYISNHIKFQFSVFNTYLFYKNSKRVKTDALVSIEIKRAVIMHQKCLRVFKSAKCLMAWFSLCLSLYTIGTSIVGIFLVTFDDCSTMELATISLLLLNFFSFSWFSYLVQNVFDEINQVYVNLIDFPWFNWNQQNKTTFLILLLKNVQPLEDKYYDIPALDFRMLLQVTRIIYSIVAFFINIRKIQ